MIYLVPVYLLYRLDLVCVLYILYMLLVCVAYLVPGISYGCCVYLHFAFAVPGLGSGCRKIGFEGTPFAVSPALVHLGCVPWYLVCLVYLVNIIHLAYLVHIVYLVCRLPWISCVSCVSCVSSTVVLILHVYLVPLHDILPTFCIFSWPSQCLDLDVDIEKSVLTGRTSLWLRHFPESHGRYDSYPTEIALHCRQSRVKATKV